MVHTLITRPGRTSRVRSHCRFRNRSTDYHIESGIKRMNGSAKRRRAPRAPPATSGAAAPACPTRAPGRSRGRWGHAHTPLYTSFAIRHRKQTRGWRANDLTAHGYDAFGDNWTSFRELEWKAQIFCGREVRKTPKASYLGAVRARRALHALPLAAQRPGRRVRPHCRFRNTVTESLSRSGMKWMSGSATRRCGRALPGRPRGGLRRGVPPPRRVGVHVGVVVAWP